jgi:hypothetical protein
MPEKQGELFSPLQFGEGLGVRFDKGKLEGF